MMLIPECLYRESKKWIPTQRSTTLGVFVGMTLIVITGCQSAPKAQQPDLPAMRTLAEGLANTQVSQEDLKRLGVSIEKDPEVKSAVQAVNSAFSVQDTGVKYCPKDGKRYSSRLEYCPEHTDIKLILVE